MKSITGDRINFYLDSDKECRWEYVGVIVDGDVFSVNLPEGTDISVTTGRCSVCGKTPIMYNYILKYNGKEKDFNYASVGSECIQYLNRVDMLRIAEDKKKIKEKSDKTNAIIFGKYIKTVFLPQHPDLWNMKWEYFGKEKNIGGSLNFLAQQCMEGNPLNEKTFGKDLKQALKVAGFSLPDMRTMKKVMPGSTDEKVMPEIRMVPDGFEMVDYYGISPITGQRDILYVTLKDKDGNEEFPSVSPEWNPIIEITTHTDRKEYEPEVLHVHLQKFIQMNTKKEDPVLVALKILAGNDPDFASTKNNIGFNGFDAEFGHSLASNDHLSDKQRELGKRLLKKYHRQIPKQLWEDIYGE